MSRNEELLEAILGGSTVSMIPQSRTEEYLKAIANNAGVSGLPDPISRNDALLYAIAEQGRGGSLEPCTVALNNFSGDTNYRVTFHYTDTNGQYKSVTTTTQSYSISDAAKGTPVVMVGRYIYQGYTVVNGGTLVAENPIAGGIGVVIPTSAVCIITGKDND